LLGLFQAELLKIAQFADFENDTRVTTKIPPMKLVKGGVDSRKVRQKCAHRGPIEPETAPPRRIEVEELWASRPCHADMASGLQACHCWGIAGPSLRQGAARTSYFEPDGAIFRDKCIGVRHMTLPERIESFTAMSAGLQAELEELHELREKVRLAEDAALHKKIPAAFTRRGS
jgi:hypothetical protein